MSAETAPAATQLPFEKSIAHLSSYPVVSSTISAIQSYPLAQTAQATAQAYSNTATKYLAPLSPLFQKATEISQPFVSKADNFADSGLGKVDAKWPIVKETPENIRARAEEILKVEEGRKLAKGLVEMGQKEKEHVFQIYQEELKKNGETAGYIPMAKASISTSLLLSHEFLNWLSSYLASKKTPTETKKDKAPSEKPTESEHNVFTSSA